MPKDDAKFFCVRDLSEATKKKIKLYAAEHDVTMAKAVEMLVDLALAATLPESDQHFGPQIYAMREKEMTLTRAVKQTEEQHERALALKQQGWAERDIAAAVGVSEPTVSQWVRRARKERDRDIERETANLAYADKDNE